MSAQSYGVWRDAELSWPVLVLRSLGVWLLVTAGLKFWSAAQTHGPGFADCFSPGTLVLVAAFEAMVGVCLLVAAARWTKLLLWAALGLFLIFLVTGMTVTVSGRCSRCGCLGPIDVSPRWMVVIDSFILGILLTAVAQPWTWSACLVALAPLTVASGWAWLDYRWQLNHGAALGSVDVTKWVGLPLPLLPALENASLLQRGRWMVVLYDGECGRCQSELAAMERHFRGQFGMQVAVLVLRGSPPAVSPAVTVLTTAERYQRLAEGAGIPFPTPAYFIVDNGRVVDVAAHWKRLKEFQSGDDVSENKGDSKMNP